MASGNGVVVMAQKYKGYGNYILLKHNSTFKTAYAHLSKYGRGVRRGVRVTQGQIIGYVGSTGMSTGPHLHYEIIKDGHHINPQSVNKGATGQPLAKTFLPAFSVKRDELLQLLKQRQSHQRLASGYRD